MRFITSSGYNWQRMPCKFEHQVETIPLITDPILASSGNSLDLSIKFTLGENRWSARQTISKLSNYTFLAQLWRNWLFFSLKSTVPLGKWSPKATKTTTLASISLRACFGTDDDTTITITVEGPGSGPVFGGVMFQLANSRQKLTPTRKMQMRHTNFVKV